MLKPAAKGAIQTKIDMAFHPVSTKKNIFVTGTDTGVGKTLLTALLLHHLRQTAPGRTLAMKPFCSGSHADVRLLQSLQPGELTDAEANPFYFAQPVAPFVAAQKNQRKLRLNDVMRRIQAVQKKCDQLLIEGSGGLLVPLGAGFNIANLIEKLDCRVIVAACNRLGAINHTMLTINHLQMLGIPDNHITVVLMTPHKTDLSSRSNQSIIATLARPIPVFTIPFLGIRADSTRAIQKNGSKTKKVLQKIIS